MQASSALRDGHCTVEVEIVAGHACNLVLCCTSEPRERMLRTREGGGRRKRNISLFSLSLSPSFTSLALSLTPLHILWILHECVRVTLRYSLRLLLHCDAAAARCCAERRPSHLHTLQLALLCSTLSCNTRRPHSRQRHSVPVQSP